MLAFDQIYNIDDKQNLRLAIAIFEKLFYRNPRSILEKLWQNKEDSRQELVIRQHKRVSVHTISEKVLADT